MSNSARRMAMLALIALSGSGCMHLRHRNDPIAVAAAAPDVPSELRKVALPAYVIEPPDALLIDVYLPPREFGGPAIELFPQPISGQHLVGMDGTVKLGIWGEVCLAGLTREAAQERVRAHVIRRIREENAKLPADLRDNGKLPAELLPQLGDPSAPAPKIEKKNEALLRRLKFPPDLDPSQLLISVDVLAYNSKSYYVITDGAGYGEQIYRAQFTGNETVLDALSQINGIPAVGSKRHVWVARRTPHGVGEQILHVDYNGTSALGLAETNYQILPGDRVYVQSQGLFRINNFVSKALAPIEQIFGVTLLGSSTVNSIKGRNLSNSNGAFR